MPHPIIPRDIIPRDIIRRDPVVPRAVDLGAPGGVIAGHAAEPRRPGADRPRDVRAEHAPHILLAEDDDDLRSVLAALLRADGNEVTTLEDGDGIRSYVYDCVMLDIPRRRVDAVVSDVLMPRMSGLALLGYLQDLGCRVPTVLVTAALSEEVRQKARALGAYAVLDKPLDADELLRVVREALHPVHPADAA